MIRKILRKEIIVSSEALAGLYMADRLDHLSNVDDGIIQKLEEGFTVICDRYYMSSLAYNSLTTSISWVIDLNKKAMETLRPHMTIFLDIPVDESINRITKGRETPELFEQKEILEKVRANYLEAIVQLSPYEHIVTIDANQEPDKVHQDIRNEVEKVMF